MTYEFHLRRANSSWRPSFVRNTKNFANVIANYRSKYAKAPAGSAEERQIVSQFNAAYNAWMAKVKNENTKRRTQEASFFTNLRAARKSGNSAAVGAVLAKYSNARKSPSRTVAAVQRRSPIARSPAPKRTGKKRNTSSLRKMIAHRNLSRTKADLMARKAALESERNKLENKIFTIIRKLGELPY
ncbi:hypothetical protein [Yellowstone lake phycodnavirus 3]|uniref:hypothetical protein n=1 Tax=Yellowstone lake phycodnavirus 3 TaxID=1586715 RepID=UPI0006EB3037|nr:hypothetical protein AR677_gp034 [Yellowstone lake phycodnavirus 3]BAT22533.1 hypothetical protein [Yellowstone lake phycodnavirus 3]